MASPAYYNISVGTTALQIVGNVESVTTIYNNGTATIYLGYDLNVTTVNGLPIVVGAAYNISSQATQNPIWAISGTAGQDVRVFLGAL
jgi:hypothetical protein